MTIVAGNAAATARDTAVRLTFLLNIASSEAGWRRFLTIVGSPDAGLVIYSSFRMLRRRAFARNAMHTYSSIEYVCIALPGHRPVISLLNCQLRTIRNNNT
jgi:hypothetical protein